MLDPSVAVVAGILATAILAALLARPLGIELGIERDRAFKVTVATGAIVLAVGALLGLVVGNLFDVWQLGQAVGTYAAIAVEAVLAAVVIPIRRRRSGASS